MVAPHGTDLVEFISTVSLSCSSSGSSLSFFWTNSSSNVTASDRVQISVTDEGTKLTIVNVTRHDKGPYICNVFNPVSKDISDPVNLFISYGPDNIQLMVSPSKEKYPEGSDISLRCSVESEPVPQYLWFMDGNRLSNTGPELSLTNIQVNQSGNYSCQTFNSKTMRYITSQPSAIIVHESTPSSGLSTGVIVAIVVVCLVVVIGLGVGYYMVSKKPWKNPFSENTSRTTGGNNQSNADNSSEEMNYARLKFPKKTKVNKNPADSDNPLSEYTQVRVNNDRSAASGPPADEQSYTEVKIPTNRTGWVQQAQTGFSSSDYAQIRVNSDRHPVPPPKTYKPQIDKRLAPQPGANGEPVYGVVNKSQRR
uniref:Hemicentin-1-like protein n=1 Tax=Fundulus heteroclitus TaxID=8078 RepID=A0A146XH50_FUNHE